MKIAICASEVVPFAKTGGLADVTGALPLALEELGQEVIVVMPGYKAVKNAKAKIARLKEGVSYAAFGKGAKVYFIENEKYFNRDNLYGDKAGDYPDNLDRFSFYCRKALELFKDVNFKPDIVHVHDWQASLIPLYLKALYTGKSFYKDIKTVLTIHNIGYQGLFPKEEFVKLGLDWSIFNIEMLEFYGRVNLLKGGIVFSDVINTVSRTYSQEIQTKEFGFGLEGALIKRRDALFGILNGLDYSIWNPETDTYIAKNFSIQTIADKAGNKDDLQKFCKLPLEKGVPLFGIVSRLAEQKGFDILAEAMPSLCKMDIQLVILGTGDLKYHTLLEGLAKKYPRKLSLHLKFDDTLAHKIYAGSDVFLMPSKYEPCGLGQMISLRYATLPLVFKTGGLADTVTQGNGFVFDRYAKDELLSTIKKAAADFKGTKKWLALQQKAMQCNFSWKESGAQYIDLYKKAGSA